MSIFFADLNSMIASGFERSTIEEGQKRNALIQKFLDSPLGDHLRAIENIDTKEASGGRLLGAVDAKAEIDEYAPGCLLFPHGYFPIWSSIGGQLVVYGLKEAAFLWADQEGFMPETDSIMLPGTLKEVPYTPENIPLGLVEISREPPDEFLRRVRAGDYTARFDELD